MQSINWKLFPLVIPALPAQATMEAFSTSADSPFSDIDGNVVKWLPSGFRATNECQMEYLDLEEYASNQDTIDFSGGTEEVIVYHMATPQQIRWMSEQFAKRPDLSAQKGRNNVFSALNPETGVLYQYGPRSPRSDDTKPVVYIFKVEEDARVWGKHNRIFRKKKPA